MDTSKKILNIAMAFGIVALSLSALIYSIKDNKAAAAPQGKRDGSVFVGAIIDKSAAVCVVKYYPNTGQFAIEQIGTR